MAASIWDFFFSFDADTDGVEGGIRDTERHARRLEGTLNDVDQIASSVFGHLRDVGGELVGMAAGVFAIGSLIGSIQETVQFSLEMGTLAERAGLAVETFGALTDQARQLGGAFTESEMFTALERLQNETDDVYGTLERFQDLAAGLDSNSAIRLGDSLGIDPVLVNVLQQADGSLQSLTERYVELGGLTTGGLGALRATYQAWNELRQIWSNSVRDIAISIGPALTDVLGYLKEIINWASQNSDAVRYFFLTVAAIITGIYLPTMIRAAIATTAATWPFILMVAAIGAISAAIALLVDDFLTFERGGQSVIGGLVARWPVLGDRIEDVRAIVLALVGGFKSLGSVVDGFLSGGIVGGFDALGGSIAGVYRELAIAFPEAAGFFNALADGAEITADAIGRLISVFVVLISYIAEVVNAFGMMFVDPARGFEMLGNAADHLFDGLLNIFPEIKELFDNIFDYGSSIFTSLGETISDLGTDAWNAITGVFGGDTPPDPGVAIADARAGLADAQTMASATRQVMTENQTTMNTNNSSRNVTVNNGPATFNIQSNDPEAVAREVEKVMNGMSADLEAETRTGIQ